MKQFKTFLEEASGKLPVEPPIFWDGWHTGADYLFNRKTNITNPGKSDKAKKDWVRGFMDALYHHPNDIPKSIKKFGKK